MTFTEWYMDYCVNRMKFLRLGQAFCNDFIRHSWPELYYCEDGYESYSMICDWLETHCYLQTDTMPEKVK